MTSSEDICMLHYSMQCHHSPFCTTCIIRFFHRLCISHDNLQYLSKHIWKRQDKLLKAKQEGKWFCFEGLCITCSLAQFLSDWILVYPCPHFWFSFFLVSVWMLFFSLYKTILLPAPLAGLMQKIKIVLFIWKFSYIPGASCSVLFSWCPPVLL